MEALERHSRSIDHAGLYPGAPGSGLSESLSEGIGNERSPARIATMAIGQGRSKTADGQNLHGQTERIEVSDGFEVRSNPSGPGGLKAPGE